MPGPDVAPRARGHAVDLQLRDQRQRRPARPARASQQHDRHGRRRGQVFVLDLAEDVDRADLGLERQVAGDQHERAELADGAREAERDPGDDRRRQRRQHDPPQHRHRAGARARRRLPPSSGRARAAPAAPSARRTAASRTAAPGAIAARVNAMSIPTGLPLPYSASSTTPGDDRRQRERQVDQRVDDPSCRGIRRAPSPTRSACRRPR